MRNRLARVLLVGVCLSSVLAGVAWRSESVSASPQGEGARKTPSNRRNFVTCPIVRDTSTLPCWLAEYEGELYYLGSQGSSGSAFYPPQLGHEALVEGTVSAGPRICGGIALTPVRVSVITELNPACNKVLPAEAAFTPAPSPIAPLPRFADTTREFTVPYDFDNDYLTLHATRFVVEAARVAKLTRPARVEVRGLRGATLLSNGHLLAERARIGEIRATTMGEHLVGLGVPADRVHVTWQTEPDPPDGTTDPEHRRVTITLTP